MKRKVISVDDLQDGQQFWFSAEGGDKRTCKRVNGLAYRFVLFDLMYIKVTKVYVEAPLYGRDVPDNVLYRYAEFVRVKHKGSMYVCFPLTGLVETLDDYKVELL